MLDNAMNNTQSYPYLEQIFQELFSRLRNPREVHVLKQRYHLETSENPADVFARKATLQSIGIKEGITRERVRQIENSAIKNLMKVPLYEARIKFILDHLENILNEHAGVMAEHHLITQALRHIEEAHKRTTEARYLHFTLNKLLTEKLIMKRENEIHEKIWAKNEEAVQLLHTAITEIQEFFRRANRPLTIQELAESIKHFSLFKEHEHMVIEHNLENILIASNALDTNPFAEWGMKEWASIVPKRIGDKIYMVLKKHGKPLHYKIIAEYIKAYNFDHKKAHPPTIHNELILDGDKYVLVGRGTYGLREDGYKKGIMSGLLEEVLKASPSREMTRDEIVKEILKQRQVKESTIYLALNDKAKFQKTLRGTYMLLS